MDLRLCEAGAVALFLHLVRAGAFFGSTPLFGRLPDTAFLRLCLALALGSVFWWVGPRQLALPTDLLALGALAVREAFVGLALGFATGLLLAVLVAAGEIVGNEMGFAMAHTINPESGADSTVVAQLFQVFGFLLLLQFDLHHEVLRVLGETYRACPVGQPFAIAPICSGLQALIGASIGIALQYAFPVLGVMLLLTVALVLLGRAVPQINLMEFGYAARALAGLLAAAWFLAAGTPFLLRAFAGLLDGARAMFAG